MAFKLNGVELSTRGTAYFNGSEVKKIIYNGTEVWRKANALIPVMTSNTTPSGTVSCSSKYSNDTDAYKAFDGSLATNWLNTAGIYATGIVNQYIAYDFPNHVYIDHLGFIGMGTDASYLAKYDTTIYVYVSNGSKSWLLTSYEWSADDAYNEVQIPIKTGGLTQVKLTFSGRMRNGAEVAEHHYVCCAELQAYGHEE